MKTGRAKRLKLEQRSEPAPWHVTRLAKEEQGEGVAVRDPSERASFRAT
jgi:hypothetical protein